MELSRISSHKACKPTRTEASPIFQALPSARFSAQTARWCGTAAPPPKAFASEFTMANIHWAVHGAANHQSSELPQISLHLHYSIIVHNRFQHKRGMLNVYDGSL